MVYQFSPGNIDRTKSVNVRVKAQTPNTEMASKVVSSILHWIPLRIYFFYQVFGLLGQQTLEPHNTVYDQLSHWLIVCYNLSRPNDNTYLPVKLCRAETEWRCGPGKHSGHGLHGIFTSTED